ncbi:DUF4012 domain-containing protein [Microbacterium sp. SLBN-146]|uniref:DUF4012 domain-containing protein n=1 Tax=Microbacterium sp. SLBN-146 TaxID=2768457 RepID=UPI001174D514|nr:DUF4012 domain-containing protein [Microbacterium sp. SLBN-146]TQJ29709.1 uncharacterized protein DUF4012 [Microbacterium sp. SLBN-146]
MTESATTRPMRIAGRVFAWALGAFLVLMLIGALWVAARGALAYGHLRAVQEDAATAREQLADPAAAASVIESISRETSAARGLTSDPVWSLAEGLPWVGPQLAAVSTIAAAADDVASTALTPLVDVAASFSIDALRPQGGRIDLSGFVEMQDAAQAAARGLGGASQAVDALDRPALLSPLRDAVDEVAGLLDESLVAADAAARTTALLPAMLGADGPRDYLVLFQNNAEWRSLGGIPGAMALIHTDNGTLTLAAQDSTEGFPRYDEPVLDLGPEVTAIYGERPGRWMQNVTQVPDFSVSAALAREMWLREHGQEVDGVISIDPVSLSYLLTATGPVTLAGGDVLTSENAVSMLLNEVYLRYPDPADQDAYFASAAAAVFGALASGQAEPAPLVEALTRAADERRLMLWSAHEADQSLLADTTLAAGLPVSDRTASRFGVYLNDGTGSKMDYYQRATSTIEWQSCATGASGTTGEANLTVTLANEAPADAASLPRYITGGGNYDVPAGTARTITYVYLPEGFDLIGSELTTGAGFGGGTHNGHRVVSFTVDLAPGESATAVLTARTTEPSASTLIVDGTPTTSSVDAVAASCDTP